MTAVDWSTLEHAHGEASNVPRILGALASEDAAQREGGFYDLDACLCHQGSVYSATLAAIPRLLELVAAPSYPERSRLLQALGRIVNGDGCGVDMADVRRALADGHAVLVRIVDETETEAEDEAEAVRALGIFAGPEFAMAGDALDRIARTADAPLVRAAAWRALASVAPDRVPATVDDEPPVQLVVSLLRAVALGAQAPDATLERVATGMRDQAAWSQAKAWAKRHGWESPRAFLATQLAADPPRFLDEALAELENSYHTEDATEIAAIVLAAAFAEPEEGSGEELDRGQLSDLQRRVLATVAQSESLWGAAGRRNDELLDLLKRRGLPADALARERLLDVLGIARKRRVVIITPRQVRHAREVAILLGREAWLDAPFIFLTESCAGLDDAIADDPDDFPPEVMDAFHTLQIPMLRQVVQHTCPVATARFYPQLSVEALESVVRELGFEIVPPNLFAASELCEDDEDEDVDVDVDVDVDEREDAAPRPDLPACRWSDLTSEVRASLADFVERFAAAGFNEVEASYATARTMGDAGIAVSPLAMARRFGEAADLEVGFHCDQQRGAFLRIVLASRTDEDGYALRASPPGDELFATVTGLDQRQQLASAVKEILGASEHVLLEYGDGLLELGLSDDRG